MVALLLCTLTDRLNSLCNSNFNLHDSSLRHAPAALSQVSFFLSNAVSTKLPDNMHCIKALQYDPEAQLLLEIIFISGLAGDSEKVNAFIQFTASLLALGTSVSNMVYFTQSRFLT